MSDPPPARPSRVARVLESIGAPVVFTFDQARGIARVARLTLWYTLRGRKRWGEIWWQSYRIGNQSIIFITAVAAALGLTLVYQSSLQAQRITGDLTMIGGLYLQILLREFAPTITALMLATRVGTGIAAEIGSMVVTEQVDALRMSGAHPIDYLVVPRFLATTLMGLCLTIYSVLIFYLAGMTTAYVAFGVSPYTFVKLNFIIPGDIILFLGKTLTYSMSIPIIAGHSGLAAHGGSEGVGLATTQSVVNCSLGVILIDFAMSSVGYVFLFR